eukprot:9470222-Pyramimonas_sp.AAC.3
MATSVQPIGSGGEPGAISLPVPGGDADAGDDQDAERLRIAAERRCADGEMDLADDEYDEFERPNFDELRVTLAENLEDHHDEHPDHGEYDDPGPDENDEGAIASLFAGAAAGAEVPSVGPASGLQQDCADDDKADSYVPAVPKQPWELLSEMSKEGYVAYRNRSVIRIQRGRPAKSTTVTCFRHTGCRLCITESRCPSDEELFKWLFEIPEDQAGDDRDTKRARASAHMNSARERWYAKKPSKK